MPRKPQPKKRIIAVSVNSHIVDVTLFPPSKAKKTWYAYWTGLSFSRSTGQTDFDEAVRAVESMLRNQGRKSKASEAALTDEEFIRIQHVHFGKAQGEEQQERALRSLRECLDAITAFQELSHLKPISLATADDCERFQREALAQPKNWRIQYAPTAKSNKRRSQKDEPKKLSPNTVLKWSTALQAAFERANRNAGKKCVRGVVPEPKLLTDNPWKHFTWIKGKEKPLRHFDLDELRSLIDWFATEWGSVSVAQAFIKVSLWSWARRSEVSCLQWSDERRVENECHFRSVGKWGVVKWFRIPEKLRGELELLRCPNDFVFGDFPRQLIHHYRRQKNLRAAMQVREDFDPYNVGDWMYRQVVKWSEIQGKGDAYLHVFRKTGLQFALSGEHIRQNVADDARVTSAVMAASYAQEFNEELRLKSNRTFGRILSSLPTDVAALYGYEETPRDRLAEQLNQAGARGDWKEVSRLAEELQKLESGMEGE